MKENQRYSSSIIQEYNQNLIYEALNQCKEGEIAIVWDRVLPKQMDVLISSRYLSENFNVTQNLALENNTIKFCTRHVVYFLSSVLNSVEQLIKNFPKEKDDYESSRKYHVFFIPEINYVLIERLKAVENIWKQIKNSVSFIACHWFPNDQPNFIHLALPQFPHRMLIDGDWNFMYKCAVALSQLKNQLIPYTTQLTFYCQGEWSIRIVEMLKRIENQNEYVEKTKNSYINSKLILNVNKIVIMDRWLDVLTPMLTQFTFAGAIDEIFKIDVQGKTNPFIEYDNNFNSMEYDTSQEQKVNTLFKNGLILKGTIYEQLQDLHLNAIGGQIKEILRKLREEEKMLKSVTTVNDLKNCVGKIQKVLEKREWTKNLLKIAELIQYNYSKNFFVNVLTCQQDIFNNAQTSNGGGGDKVYPFIENAIIECRNPCLVLRLIAIQSLASSKGLRSHVAHTYRKLFIQSYGIFSLRWWSKLQLANIIREETSYLTNEQNFVTKYPITNYTQLAKRFRLYYPEVDEIKADDSAYAFNGRTSLLLRYFEDGLQNNWRNFVKFDKLRCDTKVEKDAKLFSDKISNSNFETIVKSTKQKIPHNLNNYNKKLINSNNSKPSIMLFVIGGLTRAEISAIRLLHYNQVCLCASTSVITANSLLTSFR